jgi:hypothetical protein
MDIWCRCIARMAGFAAEAEALVAALEAAPQEATP